MVRAPGPGARLAGPGGVECTGGCSACATGGRDVSARSPRVPVDRPGSPDRAGIGGFLHTSAPRKGDGAGQGFLLRSPRSSPRHDVLAVPGGFLHTSAPRKGDGAGQGFLLRSPRSSPRHDVLPRARRLPSHQRAPQGGRCRTRVSPPLPPAPPPVTTCFPCPAASFTRAHPAKGDGAGQGFLLRSPPPPVTTCLPVPGGFLHTSAPRKGDGAGQGFLLRSPPLLPPSRRASPCPAASFTRARPARGTVPDKGFSSAPPAPPPVTTCFPCPAASFTRARPARGTVPDKGFSSAPPAPPPSRRACRARRLPSHERAPQGGRSSPTPSPLSVGLAAPCDLLPISWHEPGSGVGGSASCDCRIPSVCRGLDTSASPGVVCGIQRRGARPKGRKCPHRGRVRAPPGPARRRSPASGPRAGARESCRRARPVRATSPSQVPPGGHGSPPHRVSKATGRPSRPSSCIAGPPSSREPSCAATGGSSVAPRVHPPGDARLAGAPRRWCGRCIRVDRPSRRGWRCG